MFSLSDSYKKKNSKITQNKKAGMMTFGYRNSVIDQYSLCDVCAFNVKLKI